MAVTQQPLVVVGSVNADLAVQLDRLPSPGETLSASTLEFFPGGKGANQAAAAARAGCHTYFVGQVGKDANAPVLREALAGAGVDLTHMREVEGPTGTALILLQPGGENSIIIVGGANQSGWEVSEPAKQLLATAGAGDCFTATYAVAVLEGKSPAAALQFASAAAALCVQCKGAMPSLPSRAEVDSFLATQTL
ncbi:MAG: hypothetical protein WDW38_001801 [Sanguina aurantia]